MSGWLEYITGSPAESDEPASGCYVVAAVLSDETLVKVDSSARYYPAAQSYQSRASGLYLSDATRGPDGVYTTDSGCYRVMSEAEYTVVKHEEAMRAEARASAAVVTPRTPTTAAPGSNTTTTTTASANGATRAMEDMALAALPVGCGADARMATVVAVGPRNVGLARRRAKTLIDVARANHNRVVTVVLGVDDENEAYEALSIPGERVLLAGANEMRALGDRNAKTRMRLYLEEACLLECIAGSAAGTGTDGSGGVWVLPSAHIPLSSAPTAPSVAKREHDSLVSWKNALNAQWHDWYRRYQRTDEPLDAQDNALLDVYSSFADDSSGDGFDAAPPLRALGDSAVGLLGMSTTMRRLVTHGLVDHTIVWTADNWPETGASWASTGGGAASVYWAASSWCYNTQTAMRRSRPNPLMTTLPSDEDEWHADVDTLLVSLLTYTAPGGTQPFLTRFDDLKGVLGPVVRAGRGDSQLMRVSWWTLHDRTGGVVALLPEGYVRRALHGYEARAPPLPGSPLLAAQGFLVLADADALPLVLPNVDARVKHTNDEERDEAVRAFGRRLWIPNGATAAERHVALAGLEEVPNVATALATFRTQLDTDAALSGGELVPGHRVTGLPGLTVFYTSTVSDDGLSGLRVRWVRRDRAPHMPTLDIDTHEQGVRQTAYESV